MVAAFDEVIQLKGRHSMKWDGMDKVGCTVEDAIPMWVADMDFATADPIRDALRAEADLGVMGYYGNTEEVAGAVRDWFDRRHDWKIDPEAVRFTNGVLGGFASVLEAFSEPGDSIILFTPVYHAFFRKAHAQGRRVRESEMILNEGRYELDLDGLAASLDGSERIVVLCSPHNPGGRMWSGEEIRALAEFAAAHDLILLSDEIHMDLTFPDAEFTPAGVAAEGASDRLVVITAASKSFNIAGGETGYMVIPNATLRERIDAALPVVGGIPNRFGLQMTMAAYREGMVWLDGCRRYLADNFALWHERIDALEGVSVMDMEATYLSWVDFRGRRMDADELQRFITEDARIAASPGPQFGTGGPGWMRFNIALPRPLLQEAIGRLEKALG